MLHEKPRSMPSPWPWYVVAVTSLFYGLFAPTPHNMSWLHEFAWAAFGGSFVLAAITLVLSV